MTAGSSSIANVAVRSKPCDPVMSNPEPAIKTVSGDPRFMRSLGVFAAGHDGRLDALATVAGDPFEVEDGDRHTL